MAEDIRWQQRFGNYRKALNQLESFLEPPVAVRKDDARAATQAAITKVAGVMSFSEGGGLIQTTSG